MQLSGHTLAFKLLIPFCPLVSSPLHPHHRFMLLAVFLYLLAPLPLWLSQGSSIECWRSHSQGHWTTTLYFVSFFDLISIQESNLNSSSSFRILGFSTLRSDRTHSRSGILSPNTTHASIDVVIIFVGQGFSFSKLSIFPLSLLDPYSDYVGVNISLNNSFSLWFLNVYAAPIRSSATDSRSNSFSPFILSSFRSLLILGNINWHHPLWNLKDTSD